MEANEQKLKEVKGKMSLFKSDKMVFTPYGQGDPVYAEVKKVGGASLARTLGEKTQSLVARLKVDALAADPAAELRDQLEKVLKGLPDPQRKPRLRGRFLRNDADLKVRLDERDGTLSVLIQLDVRNKNIVQNFNRLSMEVNKCLDYNEISLKKLARALTTCSTK
jgi:hypothetical protein